MTCGWQSMQSMGVRDFFSGATLVQTNKGTVKEQHISNYLINPYLERPHHK